LQKPFAVIAAVGLLFGCSRQTDNKTNKQLLEVPKNGFPVSVAESGDKKVDALVRQLVSERPAPFPGGYSGPELDAIWVFYDTPEVEAARKSLKEMGPTIFPALVKHLVDDRYCYSFVNEAWDNFNVRDAVVDILDDGYYMHSGYKYRKTPSAAGGSYLSFDDYLRARGAEVWAEWAKSKTRLEIQMDFIDWSIKKENERGYTDDAQRKSVLENYERARQRVKEKYSKPAG
jgi:hypothetical protein